MLENFYAAEAAYIRGDAGIEAMTDYLAADVLMAQAPALPYGGDWRGRDDFARFLTAFGDAWSALEFIEQRFVADIDTVAVYSRGRLTARASGRVLETELVQWITFRDGLITAFRPFYLDTAGVLATLDTGGFRRD
ncbi:nuclear transport factor 2 family protein [Nocardia uniformis]|uniref:Nuclear transport factor 2 family protein n=1 Tax=Nocardia uniformis TaxID=53432 RepID=A0A849CJC4_9NOCA|nr:nuclear transport factor 2 family protein [Nocardia uniformis]